MANSVKLKISVTEQNIKVGSNPPHKWCAHICCPIWQAINSIFPDCEVGSFEIRIGRYSIIPLPKNATEFIIQYHLDKTLLQPFEFEIEVPDSIIEKIDIPELNSKLQVV